jgi:uncharacterized protein YbbK (DUF523 family)
MAAEMDHRDGLTLVSACLLGIDCRYDGQGCPDRQLRKLAVLGYVVPFCPEVFGGLSIPRLPAEIEDAHIGLDGHAVLDGRTRVVTRDGRDFTVQFLAGAKGALALARRLGIRRSILKSNSPSCGVGQTYDGRFTGTLVPGDGVTAALLRRSEIQVFTERDVASIGSGAQNRFLSVARTLAQ